MDLTGRRRRPRHQATLDQGWLNFPQNIIKHFFLDRTRERDRHLLFPVISILTSPERKKSYNASPRLICCVGFTFRLTTTTTTVIARNYLLITISIFAAIPTLPYLHSS